MKIVIPGGSGQIGRILTTHFHNAGHEVVILSRNAQPGMLARCVLWDGRTLGNWHSEIDGADVLINLAGRSVNCRYNKQNRAAIRNSRVDSTHAIGQAIAMAASPPPLWLQMSTATLYAHRFDAPNDEATGLIGGDEDATPDTWRFSIDVAKAWEQATFKHETAQTRKVLMRSTMVMDAGAGGVFDTLLRLVRFGLGGRAGHGKQFISWIHYADFVRAIEWLIANDAIAGPVNLAAPSPLPNADFMRHLREGWGMPLGLASSSWMIEVGSALLRTESELIMKSRRVVPGRLLAGGFEFEYADWAVASAELCAAWRHNSA